MAAVEIGVPPSYAPERPKMKMDKKVDKLHSVMMEVEDNKSHEGLQQYYITKIEEAQMEVAEKVKDLRRLEAQRNELNAKVRLLREELQLLQEQGELL